ncbi:MAG: flavin reductase family protein [Erysipelotrichaceae bacterium]
MNRIDLEVKPYLLPMPVLIIATYDKDNIPNAMNAAWGMISDYNEISISLAEHKTTDNFRYTKAFTVSIANEDHLTACDYVGIESGSKVTNKFEKAGFHSTKSKFVNAPLIDELPMALECRVKSFENGILVGEIVNISVDEAILTNGKIDYQKLKPICYDPCTNNYLSLGEIVGKAFHDGLKLK